ncbi:hypothetical protein AGMMS49960_06910 [Betaproteobacteria bacterium]|nr:hypothetical protein AGMMS49543_21420 [Betaproteobacteria bacterium]GHT99990.1 hypothetical protein AGMMS49960_06910 [Betaproteobacteria bacterium]GHU14532.1 hypothetical protein AGMMS50225_26550 [Betaproteobacteria bacterium]GHU22854.1 hypothetical protein AGMMS50243_23220 [Betaproteobacteria bacterium]
MAPFYGAHKIVVFLKALGHLVNRKRIQRLMRQMGLAGMAPKPDSSRPHPTHKVHATMGELMVGLSEYFVFYNTERPHQALRQQRPDTVYRSAAGSEAMIVDKFGCAVEQSPVPLRSTGDCSTAETKAMTKPEAKPGQRRAAASKVECAA